MGVSVIGRVAVCLLLMAGFSVGCGGGSTPASPTPTSAPAPAPAPAPPPAPAPAPAPPPVSTTVSLTGTVASASGSRISGATVTVLDGLNSGRTTVTNSNGEYRFDTMQVANGNFVARASGYLDDARGIHVNGTATLNFTLQPVPVAATFAGTWRGQVRSSSCSADGALSTFCTTNPSINDSLVLILTQNGNSVSGTIDVGGQVARSSGTAQGNRLSIQGSLQSGDITVIYDNWDTTMSGSSMTGGFTVRFSTTVGSVRYVVALVGVSRSSSVLAPLQAPGGADTPMAALARRMRAVLRARP